MMTTSMQETRSRSAIYSCLSSSRRRYALYCLRDAEKALSLADLAEDVADLETETPRPEIEKKTVKDVYLSLYHHHVPKLADAGLVQYDRELDLVSLPLRSEEVCESVQAVTAE